MPYNFTRWSPGETLKTMHGSIGHGYMTNRILDSLDNLEHDSAIINGDMEIWQDGLTFTSIATSTYAADMWVYSKVGAMVHDVTRDADIPSADIMNNRFNSSLKIDCTTVDSAIAAGDFAAIEQRIEGVNAHPLMEWPFTVSFWIKATKTGVYCVYAKNSGADRTCVVEFTVNAADTWEYKAVTFPASPSAGTWNYGVGIGMRIGFTFACGTTFHTTANAWNTGNFLATVNQVNACDSTSNNIFITGVRTTRGSYAGSFKKESYSTLLQRCYRYYYRTPLAAAGDVFGFGQQYAATAAVVGITLPTIMRSIPTFSHSGGASFYVSSNGFANIALAAATMNMYKWLGNVAPVQITSLPAASWAAPFGYATFLYAVDNTAWLKYNSRL